MSSHTITLLTIMILAGAFGGVVNYFIGKKGDSTQSSLLRSIVVGIAASFLVPLFLSMISSDLLARSASDVEAMLVFTGFCLVAAISSTTFIRRVSDKVLQEVKDLRTEVGSIRPALDLLLQMQTEPPPHGPMALKKELIRLDKESAPVLEAFDGSPFALRSMEGIAHDARMHSDDVSRTLMGLVAQGLLRRWDGQSGERWYLTPEGRVALEQHHAGR